MPLDGQSESEKRRDGGPFAWQRLIPAAKTFQLEGNVRVATAERYNGTHAEFCAIPKVTPRKRCKLRVRRTRLQAAIDHAQPHGTLGFVRAQRRTMQPQFHWNQEQSHGAGRSHRDSNTRRHACKAELIMPAETIERTGLTTLAEHAVRLGTMNEKASADLVPRSSALERCTQLKLKPGAFDTIMGVAAHAEAKLERYALRKRVRGPKAR
jgi:hypothetical protein